MVQWPPGARIHAAARPAGQHTPGHVARAGADRAVDVGCADAAGRRPPPGACCAAGGCGARTVACPCAAHRSHTRAGPARYSGCTSAARRSQRRCVQSAPGRYADEGGAENATRRRLARPDAGGAVSRQPGCVHGREHEPPEGRRGSRRAVRRQGQGDQPMPSRSSRRRAPTSAPTASASQPACPKSRLPRRRAKPPAR
jgi:hypothetical protein